MNLARFNSYEALAKETAELQLMFPAPDRRREELVKLYLGPEVKATAIMGETRKPETGSMKKGHFGVLISKPMDPVLPHGHAQAGGQRVCVKQAGQYSPTSEVLYVGDSQVVRLFREIQCSAWASTLLNDVHRYGLESSSLSPSSSHVSWLSGS